MLFQAVATLIALNYTLTPFLAGHPGLLTVTINQPIPPDTIFVDFGDESTANTNSDSTVNSNATSFHYERLGDNASTFSVPHTYQSADAYTIYFNASNSISSFEHWAVVIVEMEIGGVEMELLSDSVVALFEEVVVKCSVVVGGAEAPFDFEWDFGDGTDGQYTMVNSTSHTSLAIHSYGIADKYNITVRIFNSQETVTTHLNTSILAVEPIEKLLLQTRFEQYATPLFEVKSNKESDVKFASDVIVFEAFVWRGSDVTFTFDFGDGHTKLVESELNVWSLPCATVKHSYFSEGVFTVSVVATNPLDFVNKTLPQPIYVQFPPAGLSLDKQYYIIQHGSDLIIHASITQGTNVSYNWMLNDNPLNKTGDKIQLGFLKPGIHLVTVEVYNKVTDFGFKTVKRPKVSSKIYVQEKLEDIHLCVAIDERETCNETELYLPLDSEIKFVAKVKPPAEQSLRFTWQLGVTELKRSNAPVLEYHYQSPGRFMVNVTAQNHISSVSTPSLVLHLIQRIANLTSIHCQGPNLVNHSITFRALYWFGTNLTFQWDFGDGSPLTTSNISHIQHIYKEVGEYWISVNVWNIFSHANITTNMFFLHHLCQKPDLSFLHTKDRICRSDNDILMEAEISTNCETSSVKYIWKIKTVNNDSLVPLNSVDIAHQRYLLIPKHFLPPGNYTVYLRVEMTGSIVYSEISTRLEVKIPDPLASIRGGYFRWIGRNDVLNVEARSNMHPGRFIWSCSPLTQKHLPCFQGTYPTAFTSSETDHFQLPVSSFVPGLEAVVLNLTIQGAPPISSSQVIEIKQLPHVLAVDVECKNCYSHRINQAVKVEFKATCRNCLSGNVEYEWKIWRIEDGSHKMHFSNYKCVQADGSTFFIVAPNSTLPPESNDTFSPIRNFPGILPQEENHGTVNHLISEDLPPFPSLPGFPEETNFPIVMKRSRSVRDTQHEFKEDLPDILPYQLFPLEEDAHYDFNSTFFNITYPDFLPFPPDFDSPDYSVPEEGTPGESGSAVARDQSSQRFKIYLSEGDGDILEGAGKPREDGTNVYVPGTNNLGDAVRDYSGSSKAPIPHLINKPRSPLQLNCTSTSTGFNSEYLILKPGVLRIGSTYLVQVNVKDKETEMEGLAMDYLNVKTGPINGRCTLMPVEGFSLNFNFRMHCLEWKSEHKPLYYQLRYSLSPNDTGHLIYFGLNRNVKFVLPSGFASDSYNVYLNVIVQDDWATSTRVCSLIREVRPLPLNGTLIQYVYNETFHPSSQLARYVREKQNQALFHQIHVLSMSVNNHGLLKGVSSKDKIFKEQIRFRYLELVENVKILSKVEAIQALSCLKEIMTAVPELTAFEIQKAFNIYQKLHDIRLKLHGFKSESLQHEFLVLASQLLYIAESALLRNEELIHVGRKLFTNEIKVILKTRLKMEEASIIDVPHTFASAAYVERSDEKSKLECFFQLKHTRVQVSDNFSSISRTRSKRIRKCSMGDCMNKDSCAALVAQEFDYVSMPRYLTFAQLLPVQKKSVSLTALSCDELENVPLEKPLNFSAKFSRNHDYQDPSAALLSVHYMNIHEINITGHANHSLIIHIRLESMGNVSANDYHLEVMFRREHWPTPTLYSWKDSFFSGSLEQSFFIPSDLVQEPGRYYSSVWTHHNQDIQNEVIGEYRMYIFEDVCIGKYHGAWSTDVCYSLQTSDYFWTDCKCAAQEMTAYSVFLPSSVFIVPVKDLIEPYFNPFPIAVIILSLLIYFVLLVFNYRKDKITNLSCVPTPLSDNSNNHKQLYVLCIKTGMHFSSGTTASVFVVLHGVKGMTETRQLIGAEPKKFSFQKGSVDLFLMSTKQYLGPLIKIEVWHNNHGSSPSWFLDNIIVKDIKTGSSYRFDCFKWLSADRGDGQIERELPVSDCDLSFTSVFWDNLVKFIHDFNMWSCVVCKSPTSFFTGVQRLTCCLGFYLNCAVLSFIFSDKVLRKSITDYNLPHISEATIPDCLLISVIASFPQLISMMLFRYSRVPAIRIDRTFSQLFCSLSLHHLYCWLRHKRSNTSHSSRSSSSGEGSDSLYSSFGESSVMSIPGFVEESSATEEKDGFSESIASTDINDPVSPLQKTLSSWQAFENWVRKKHDLISKSDVSDRQEIYIEKSDSVLAPEEIALEELQHQDVSEHRLGISGSELSVNSHQGSLLDEVNHPSNFELSNKDLDLCFHLPFLHPCFHYIAWALVVSNVISSLVITVVRASSFSSVECIFWMKHTFLAVICSFVIITPIFVFLFALLSSLKLYHRSSAPSIPPSNDQHIIKNNLDSTYKRIQYFKNYLRPPQEQVLEQFRKLVSQERHIFDFQSCLWQKIFMLILLLALLLPEDTRQRYLQRTSIFNTLFRSHHPFGNPHSIRSMLHLSDWFQSSFIDEFFGDEHCIDEDMGCGLHFKTGCILVGNVVIRIFRVPSLVRYLSSKDTFNRPASENISFEKYERRTLKGDRGNVYNFEDDILFLSNEKPEAERQLELFVNQVLNVTSGAVSLEFLLHNPSFSTLTSVSLLFEVVGDKLDIVEELSHLRLSVGSDLGYHVKLGLHLVFLLVTLIKVKNLSWHVSKIGVSQLKTLQNLFSTLIIIFSFVCIIVTVMFGIHLEAALEKLKKTQLCSNLDISAAASFETASTQTLAFVIFLQVISLIQVLYFSSRVKKILKRISSSWNDILMLFFVFLFSLSILNLISMHFVSITNNTSHPFLNCLKGINNLFQLYRMPQVVNPENRSFSNVILLFVVVALHLLLLSFIRTVLIGGKYSDFGMKTKVTFKETTRVIKRRLIGCFQVQSPQIVSKDDYQLPIEFLLAELEQLADTLVTKASNLFAEPDICGPDTFENASVVEGFLNTQCQALQDDSVDLSETNSQLSDIKTTEVPETISERVMKRLNATMPRQTKCLLPSSLNASLASQRKFPHYPTNLSLSSSLPHRIRKTHPLCHLDSDSSDDFDLHDASNGVSLRKTKSRGKGRNNELNFAVLDDSSV